MIHLDYSSTVWLLTAIPSYTLDLINQYHTSLKFLFCTPYSWMPTSHLTSSHPAHINNPLTQLRAPIHGVQGFVTFHHLLHILTFFFPGQVFMIYFIITPLTLSTKLPWKNSNPGLQCWVGAKLSTFVTRCGSGIEAGADSL